MNIDLHHQINTAKALDIQSITTDTTTAGVVIDTHNYNGIEFVIQAGTITDGTFTPKLEHDDNVSMVAPDEVPAAFRIGTYAEATFNSAASGETRRIGYVGKKRYVKLSFVSTGTTSGGTIGASVMKYLPIRPPSEADS